jgi:nicotinate-nucleotide pyrophosphorylase (carboxylating)
MNALPNLRGDLRTQAVVQAALAEDIGPGDATTLSLVDPDRTVSAVILTRGPCVVSGGPVAELVFRQVDTRVKVQARIPDGQTATTGQTVLSIEGPARGILTAERTALNFMQRMTGIATLTRQFVDAVRPFGTTILDTRKTTPTLRFLEKYAVLCGGGRNHRVGLYDKVLIKDNHRMLWRTNEECALDKAVEESRRHFPGLEVEVEVESEAELLSALRANPEWILLDNMPPSLMARCVTICTGRCQLEASGGIRLDNVAEIAATGVNAISLGCLTHSAPAMDLSLEIES